MTIQAVQTAFNRIISAKELAEYVGVNERTIYRLANDRKLPSFKLGGKWVFDKEIINQWLTNQMIGNCAK